MYVCMRFAVVGHLSQRIRGEARGQRAGISSLLLCWSQGTNSGHQTWQKVQLLMGPFMSRI